MKIYIEDGEVLSTPCNGFKEELGLTDGMVSKALLSTPCNGFEAIYEIFITEAKDFQLHAMDSR